MGLARKIAGLFATSTSQIDSLLMSDALALKAPLASPAFTGTPTGITKAHVGLGDVDNTSDANKPVSTAQAAADALKANATDVKLTKAYTSSQQAITAGGQLVLAHGLSVTPTVVQCELVCVSAAAGYSVGDRVQIHPTMTATDSASDKGMSVVVDATNVTIRFATTATTFAIIRKDTGTAASPTNSNFELVVRAWA